MTNLDPQAFTDLPKGEQRRVLIVMLIRTIVGVGFVLWMFLLVPEEPTRSAVFPYIVLLLGLIFYVFLFRSQLGRIQRARFPGLQSAEAFILTGTFFLTIFAGFYVMIHARDPAAFSEPITHMAALYFTVTVFATVGFGDIVAVSDFARGVVTIQMILGLGFLAIVVRFFTGVARRARQQRVQSAGNDE